MSWSDSDCQTVGYAYFMNFIYVYAERSTTLHNILLDGEYVFGVGSTSSKETLQEFVDSGTVPAWLDRILVDDPDYIANLPGTVNPITLTTDGTISIKTGKQNDTSPSETGPSTVHYTTGTDGIPMPLIQGWSGEPIMYNNLSALVFEDAFIGDGVRTIPTYSVLLSNSHFNKVSGSTAEKEANPIDVIYDILKVDLQMEDNLLDIGAFINAAQTIQGEGISVGVVMSAEKGVMYWIDELLRIVDGSIFYDSLTNKLSIKLFRYDYDPNTIVTLTDDVISEMTLDVQSWEDTYNKLTFKFTIPDRGTVGSIVLINTASRLTLGYDRPKTIDMQMINNQETLYVVANRMVAKLGVPIAALKMKVDFIDFPAIAIGSVFKLNSDLLGVSGKIFRVVKITGDSETASYLNVEAVEDFYARNIQFELGSGNDDDYVPPNYNITVPTTYLKAIDASREFTTVDSMYWMCGKPDVSQYITGVKIKAVSGGESQGNLNGIGKLLQTLPINTTTSNNPSPEYNQDYVFSIEEVDSSLYEIIGTPSSLQRYLHTLVIDDEVIGFRSLVSNGNGVYRVEGIVRGFGGSKITTHGINSLVYINTGPFNQTPSIKVRNDRPVLVSNLFNHQGVGPQVTKQVTYNYSVQKPYPPVPYFKDGNIVWRPRVASKGATYKNIDYISGGEDEGTVTGYYIVKEPNGNEVTITPQTGDILITFTPTQTGTHSIKHANAANHKFDGWVTITV